MGISLPKDSKSKAVSAGPVWATAGARRLASRNPLYRILGPLVILWALALAGPRSAAQRPQLKRPEQTPAERPAEPKKKKIKGPRALGILQLNASGKGSLIPVAILIDGHFYDATAYKADPIPMALESGTVYEAEQAGESQGLFTIAGALHSKNTGGAFPWLGTGTFLPAGAEPPKTAHKAEDVPVGIATSGDEPPRLTRSGAAKPSGADAGATAPPDSGTTAKPDEKPASADKPAAATSQPPDTKASPEANPSPAGAGPSPQGQSAPSPPAQGQSPGQTAPAPADATQADGKKDASDDSEGSYYRPTLRRGKPTELAPQNEDNEGKTGAAAKNEGNGAASAASGAAGASGPMRMLAAISDGGGPEPRPYKFFWKTGEEDERRNQMLALAQNEVKAYAAALAKNHIAAQPLSPKAAANRKAAEQRAKPVLENVQFHGYDLWLTSQPVLVLTADARIPGWSEHWPDSGAATEPYSVTVVARTDIYGDLRKLYSAVTDRFHLDVTPKLELIDVVDADGDGRGELLFRESSDAGNGYIIYRATPDKLWKMFDSLNAQ